MNEIKPEELPKPKVTAKMRGKAQKSMEDSIIALLYKEPFFACVIQAMRRHYDENTELAGVNVRNGVIDIYINPYTWLGLKGIKERAAVLKHEVYHLVNEHVFRRGNRNMFAWNIACDIAINTYIKNLPSKIYDEKFKLVVPGLFGFPDGNTAEWYYNRLPRSHGRSQPGGDDEGWCPIHDPPPGSDPGDGEDGEDGEGDSGEGKDGDGDGDKNGTGRSEAAKNLSREDCPFCQRKNRKGKGAGGFPGEAQPGLGQTLDDHSKWDESQSEDSTKDYDIETVRRILDRAVDECKNRGPIPGELLSAIERVRKSELPWKWLLKQFIVRATQVSSIHTRFRPNRRMKWVYPGRRVDYRLKLVFAVDTSGSMSDDQLDQLAAEIEATKDFADVWVIECDTRIPEDGIYLMDRKAMMKRKKNWNWRGRGGTDLRPPFQHAIDELKPDAMIYGTDGYGPAPDNPPPFPVMWVFTENHTPPATWGQKVILKSV